MYTRVCACVFLQKVCTHAYLCTFLQSVCVRVCACVSGIPVMIDPRLSPTLTHQCCFKCLLPWKQAAGIQVWYTDNGLSLLLFLSLSLSLSPPLLLHPSFTQFSPSLPPFSPSTSPRSFLFPALIFIHSSLSAVPRPPPPPSFSALPLFIQTDVFTSLSIHSCQPCRRALTSLSLPPFITLSLCTCHVILFRLSFPSSISVYLCFNSFNSCYLSVFSFCPSFLSSKLHVWI